ncbi:MAG: OmpH family outer membrane protein [Acidobacteria bacterium]|nr:MAG: OmpH family outer membrane protein [Acidobacteriota bacterium]
MSRMKLVSAAFLGLTLISTAAYAQGTQGAAQTPPKPQTQTPPPAGQTAPKPQIPAAATAPVIVPLPEGTKVAIIDPDYIAQESAAGKAIFAQLKTLSDKRTNELQNMQTQLQSLQNKKTTQAAILTPQAISQLDKDIERLNLDLQYKQQTAQKEVQDLQSELFQDLATKMSPVLEAFAKEKGLLVVFDARNGVTWAAAGMDISPEIVKRLDAIKK